MREVAVIVSERDIAGMNIKKQLLRIFDFSEGEVFDADKVYKKDDISLYTISKDTVYSEHIDNMMDADLIVFATRHQSKEGTASLCVHVPGNWGKAEFGGEDGKLCIVPATLIRSAFHELTRQAEKLDYEVTVEATHHGPLIDKPCMFIEIGSSEEQWRDERAAVIIAKTIMSVLPERDKVYPTVMVLGGGHYNQVANKILSRTGYAVGHICAKYALGSLTKEMLEQAVERSVEKPERAILDWKGLGDKKQNVVALLDEACIEYERVKDLLH
jgi:D-aminoacyl-tRNA deacylase